MKSFASHAKHLREQRTEDPHRPRYHFLPPANWMNDPNGIIEWNGKYHLFYQHNPHDAVWDNMHWGHAVSDDLVHWHDLPIALSPTPSSPDEDGCWSGCAVDNNGVPSIFYTGVQGDWELPHNQRVCLAMGTEDLIFWEKYAGNPVIAHPPEGLNVTGFRDPYVWREENAWFMAIGAGIQNIGGAVLLYESRDLYSWEYLHPLCIGDIHDTTNVWTGSVWEVPQFFPLGDKHVLTITAWDNEQLYSVYFTGNYRNHRFIPETVNKLDFGDRHFCAPHSTTDSQGRRILWGWIGESRAIEAQQAAGWSGLMSLPRVLSLPEDGKLAMRPVDEIESLRGKRHRYANINLSAASDEFSVELRNDAIEIAAEIDPSNAQECGIKLRCSPQSEEETTIFYNAVRSELGVDRRRSSPRQNGGISGDVQRGDFALPPGETLTLRVFVDCSVIEVYANDHTCITSRVYPNRSDSTGVAVFARGRARINSLDIWRLSSIW
jgi:beta-fructofuranosidase